MLPYFAAHIIMELDLGTACLECSFVLTVIIIDIIDLIRHGRTPENGFYGPETKKIALMKYITIDF